MRIKTRDKTKGQMQPRARDIQGGVHWAQVWGEDPGGDAERLPKVIITCPQER